uniref:G protein-coupled receptor n=1 Tax=Panagrellus redivivus TaxID=6233 RepID=A0A7E4W781_PANRE
MCCTSIFFINGNGVHEMINFTLMHFLLGYVGVSILISFIYRFYSLHGSLNFFHSKRGVILLALGIILYPVPSVIALYNGVLDREGTLVYIKANHPEYYDLFSQNSCYTFSKPTGMIIYAVVAAAEVSIMSVAVAFAGFKIYRLLSEKKAHFSAKTYELHRQLIGSLCAQAFIHFSFLAIPTVTGFAMVIYSFGNLRAVSLTIMPLLSMHSAALGLTTIIVTKPYRKAAKAILLRPFGLASKATRRSTVQITVFPQTTNS